MKKRRIVIASVLKPIDDTRMLEKMARSLDATQRFEVSIVGYPSIDIPVNATIQFYPLSRFRRLSWGRIVAPWKLMGIINKLRTEVLVVNTPDLLIVAILIRILFGTRLVYDIRENYYRNIRHGNGLPALLRGPIAAWVRLKEILTAPFIDHFFLAEAGYKKEMVFFRERVTILENKAASGLMRSPPAGQIRLLFSGTLAESTGIFESIALARSLHARNATVRLIIAGYCAIPSTLEKIKDAIKDLDFIELLGGDQLLPHPEILKAIQTSHFGLIHYPPSPQTANTIPTKLYEYLAAGLPILLQPVPAWLALASPAHACIPVDFSAVDPGDLLNAMMGQFYTQPAQNVTWESEVPKLIHALDHIIV